eukprot:Rhum_TRINITY_DN14379_c10_g2::Rhum_TRINITY_DN14379_c10_g2_i1::g.86436::m.86436
MLYFFCGRGRMFDWEWIGEGRGFGGWGLNVRSWKRGGTPISENVWPFFEFIFFFFFFFFIILFFLCSVYLTLDNLVKHAPKEIGGHGVVAVRDLLQALRDPVRNLSLVDRLVLGRVVDDPRVLEKLLRCAPVLGLLLQTLLQEVGTLRREPLGYPQRGVGGDDVVPQLPEPRLHTQALLPVVALRQHALEGVVPGQHLHERHTQPPDVRSHSVGPRVQPLGAHVGQRAHEGDGLVLFALEHVRDAEVGDLDDAVEAVQEVRGLQVAVDGGGVQEVQADEDHARHFCEDVLGNTAAFPVGAGLVDKLLQRAIHVLQREHDRSLLKVSTEEVDDVWAVVFLIPVEGLHLFFDLGKVPGRRLDLFYGDDLARRLVPGLPDLSRRAHAQAVKDVEVFGLQVKEVVIAVRLVRGTRCRDNGPSSVDASSQ